jgi:hypothetical protein
MDLMMKTLMKAMAHGDQRVSEAFGAKNQLPTS